MEPDEFRKLLKAAEKDNLAQILFMLMGIGGLRTIELTYLKVSSIDMSTERIWVPTAKRTDDHSRPIPVNDKLADLLKPYVKGRAPGEPLLIEKRRPVSRRHIRYLFHKYKKLANIRKTLGPHSLRHLAGIALSEAGAMPQEIAQYLGHKTVDMCMVYANLRGKRREELVKAAGKILLKG